MSQSKNFADRGSISAALRLGMYLLVISIFFVSLSCSRPQTIVAQKIDLKRAANYLDTREQWWTNWPGSARDHGTFCVSCHTALPYALARPVLREVLAERDQPTYEHQLLEDVKKRVRLWNEVGPYYDGIGIRREKS